ncbi:MAG: dihydrodipicolinate synthase family protein, partial [Saprospiraceae bacterium]|nr:dihydrodipicolinate synthase family protein [Saprospiraceae bacterium]
MKTNRRSFISTAITGSLGAPLFAMDPWTQKVSPTTNTGQPFRGIFPIMQTPFREDGEIDLEVLRKEVNFIIAAGAHGMAWPQLASEFYVLSDEERLATAEVIVSEAAGRLPVIIGVQSTNYWKVALKFARHAES